MDCSMRGSGIIIPIPYLQRRIVAYPSLSIQEEIDFTTS